MLINLFYKGEFGCAAATMTKSYVKAELFDLEQISVEGIQQAISDNCSAIIYLSGLNFSILAGLPNIFAEKSVSWTSVYLGADFFRVGPLVRPSGPCFACSTRRYLSAPGSISLSKLEALAQNYGEKVAATAFEFDGYLPTTIQMVVSESLRQIKNEDLPAGYIRRVNLLEFNIEEAVATAVHGCSCLGGQYENPGDRFYKALSSELSFLFKE